jgi:glycosyltransferase involved in cell wall biosynthesis
VPVLIGYDELRGRPNYATARNCYAPVPGVRHTRISRLPVDALARHGGVADAAFLPARPATTDAVHLWNKVSLGRSPWGVSIESILPRLLRAHPGSRLLTRFLRQRLLDDRCRFIAPISDWSRDLFLETLTPPELAVIQPKTHRVYPYQRVDLEHQPVEAPTDDEPLHIGFVGSEFFRKGGEALVAVADRWGEELDLQFHLVTRCARRDYATPWISGDHIKHTRSRLQEHPRISWYPSLPNADVLALMRRVHVGVLPTMAETFGFSLLEFMSVGRPVIGSNVQAGAEILAADRGWTLQLELRSDRLWAGRSGTDFAYGLGVLSLTEQLGAVLHAIRADPSSLVEKGRAALQHVEQRYVQERTAEMSQLYRGAFN